MSAASVGSCGQLIWELKSLSTGQVRSREREVRLADFEVVTFPPPHQPDFDLFWAGPRQVLADGASWLMKGGRGSTTKSLRLSDGFWLVLRERRAPTRPFSVLLTARRDTERLMCVERFRIEEGGTTASQAEDTGSLGLEWGQDDNEFHELLSTTIITDVTLDLRTARGRVGRAPIWQVRILAGSMVQWPKSTDGVRLAPRLRPDRSRPGPNH